jgi:hypothetical protein
MKIRRVVVELFHANTQTERETDRQTDMTKVIIAFHNFGRAPKLNKNQNKSISNTETDAEEQKHI